MRFRSIGAGVVAVMVAALSSPAVGQAPAASRGEAIYAERCKECHESGDERAPQRAALAAKPAAEIVAALTTGPMVPMAEGLTPEDKQAVAAYLTAH
jgi:polyvinyl alcohol dehydrogenase (cytochrome)